MSTFESTYAAGNKDSQTINQEFSDGNIGLVRVEVDSIVIEDYDYDISSITLNKDDVIVIAKYIGITAGDLK